MLEGSHLARAREGMGVLIPTTPRLKTEQAGPVCLHGFRVQRDTFSQLVAVGGPNAGNHKQKPAGASDVHFGELPILFTGWNR